MLIRQFSIRYSNKDIIKTSDLLCHNDRRTHLRLKKLKIVIYYKNYKTQHQTVKVRIFSFDDFHKDDM